MYGKLFECCLKPGGEISLLETSNSVVSVSSETNVEKGKRDSSISMVRLITEGHLEEFARAMFAAAKLLLSQDDAISSVWQKKDDIPF